MKTSLRGYFEPTPKLMRKIGDSLLVASAFITTNAAMADIKWLVILSAILGLIGKMGTNFFTEK